MKGSIIHFACLTLHQCHRQSKRSEGALARSVGGH